MSLTGSTSEVSNSEEKFFGSNYSVMKELIDSLTPEEGTYATAFLRLLVAMRQEWVENTGAEAIGLNTSGGNHFMTESEKEEWDGMSPTERDETWGEGNVPEFETWVTTFGISAMLNLAGWMGRLAEAIEAEDGATRATFAGLKSEWAKVKRWHYSAGKGGK